MFTLLFAKRIPLCFFSFALSRIACRLYPQDCGQHLRKPDEAGGSPRILSIVSIRRIIKVIFNSRQCFDAHVCILVGERFVCVFVGIEPHPCTIVSCIFSGFMEIDVACSPSAAWEFEAGDLERMDLILTQSLARILIGNVSKRTNDPHHTPNGVP